MDGFNHTKHQGSRRERVFCSSASCLLYLLDVVISSDHSVVCGEHDWQGKMLVRQQRNMIYQCHINCVLLVEETASVALWS